MSINDPSLKQKISLFPPFGSESRFFSFLDAIIYNGRFEVGDDLIGYMIFHL